MDNELVRATKVDVDTSKGFLKLSDDATENEVQETSEAIGGYTSNGLILYGDLYNEARRIGVVQNGKESAWLKKFADDSGYQAKAIQNAGSVMNKFSPELSRRRESLYYSHYTELASLPEDIIDEYIDVCVNEGWTKKETRKKVKEIKREMITEDVEPEEVEENSIDLDPGWYRIGKHYLYYGDNTDKEFIDFLPECKFAFADPPYNAGVDEWDSGFEWRQDYLQDVAEIVAVTPGGWNAYGFYRETKMRYIWEIACWIKNGMTHGRCGYANWIKTSIFSKGKVKSSQDFFDVTIKTGETEDTRHKGRKPYDFMYWMIDNFTDKNDIVVDPFAGSGTTLIMCEAMDRVCYTAELDKDFCIDIITRCKGKGLEYDKL